MVESVGGGEVLVWYEGNGGANLPPGSLKGTGRYRRYAAGWGGAKKKVAIVATVRAPLQLLYTHAAPPGSVHPSQNNTPPPIVSLGCRRPHVPGRGDLARQTLPTTRQHPP